MSNSTTNFRIIETPAAGRMPATVDIIDRDRGAVILRARNIGNAYARAMAKMEALEARATEYLSILTIDARVAFAKAV